MRSTLNPVLRLRRGDFQGNPGESEIFQVLLMLINLRKFCST